MHSQQEQLIQLLMNNTRPGWEVEAVHTRCCIYYGIENALEQCQELIDFAAAAGMGLLESFRLQVEVDELMSRGANSWTIKL